MNPIRLKRILISTLMTLMLSVLMLPTFSLAQSAVPKHTGAFYVNDFANVIDEKAENYMVNYGIRLHQDTGAQVVLVTVDSTEGLSMEEYATSLFNSWGVGSKDKNNGLLLLLSIQDDDYWAVQGKGVETTITNSKIKKILTEYLEPDFSAKTYSNGARKTYGAFIQALGGTWVEGAKSKIYVADNAGVFKKVTKDYLNESSNRYQATTGTGIYVVTVKNTGDNTLQDYAYKKFASIGASSKDVMLVLDIDGDNYHVLQGKDIDTILTNDSISGILDTVLEPQFVKKDYGAGATATANALYSFFLARADHSQGTAGTTTQDNYHTVSSSTSGNNEVSTTTAIMIFLIFIAVVSSIGITATRRNRYLALYGLPFNPYSRRNIRRYGTWQGQADYGYGRRWHRRYHHHQQRSAPSNNTQQSFWGNSGGGGSTNGGGAGRYSSSDENEGGGGASRGGGAGRHSSGSSSSGSSHSGGSGGSSGGGGSASSGGGAGRH